MTSDPSRPFSEWHKIETATGEQQVDLQNLEPMTSYVVCVSANHNRGLATFSRSLQVATLASPVEDTEVGVGDISKDESNFDSMQISSPDMSNRSLCSTALTDLLKSDTYKKPGNMAEDSL